MEKVKPWQIILMIAAVGVLGFSVWKFGFASGSDKGLLADSIIMVDVETGELFEYSLKGKRGVMVPANNPNSGKLSLMPVHKEPDGSWVITRRDMDAIRYVEATVKVVDRSSGVVTPANETPTRASN